MKLHVDTRFKDVTLERFIEIYFSEAFNNAVAAVSGLKKRELVEETVGEDGSRKRRVRMEPDVTLPGPIQKVLDSFAGHKTTIAYDEVSTFDPVAKTSTYAIDSKLGERAKIGGVIRFIADGDGVRRVIDGVIEIKAPLGVGMMIERFIESETQKGYVKIGAFLQKWLDDHR